MYLFELAFMLYFFKLSDGKGFWYKYIKNQNWQTDLNITLMKNAQYSKQSELYDYYINHTEMGRTQEYIKIFSFLKIVFAFCEFKGVPGNYVPRFPKKKAVCTT